MRALVADDEVTSRKLLERLLVRAGHQVSVAASGEEAWAVLAEVERPAIAVIDWMMPGVDGLELCRRLRAADQGGYVYVILVTHRDDESALDDALAAGADDFIRKPVDPGELQRRLTVGRRVAVHGDALRRRAIDLEALAESRARQLRQADRMATLGLLAAGVAHEINNPTAFVAGNVQTVKRFWADLAPVLAAAPRPADPALAARLDFVRAELPRALDGIHDGARRVATIVRELKSYARQGAVRPGQRCRIGDCVAHALELCRYRIAASDITVESAVAADLPAVAGNPQELEQILVNLVLNAADAMADGPRRWLRIGAEAVDGRVVVEVADAGPGIPAELRERIWDPFFTTKPAGVGTGLGLSICRSLAESHRGQLTCEDAPAGGGACFRLALPALTEVSP